ncbi:hypothetical protein DPMN_018456 [Dreissena polymorpha]|uniref:Uncharacterized protein n=1 Tax=Dreissena polymorpha TaxID=45954 RepID=A0A9D4S6D9_DREPO|nr:hypothetical protein DPMN_018456 [Dreissena polymorpha]
MSRIAACLGGQMGSFKAKCDLPPHTDAASTTGAASTCFDLPPRIAKSFVPLWLYCTSVPT